MLQELKKEMYLLKTQVFIENKNVCSEIILTHCAQSQLTTVEILEEFQIHLISTIEEFQSHLISTIEEFQSSDFYY